MNEETVKTIAWTLTMIFGMQGAVIYAVIRLLVTGRTIFERREPERETRGRLVGMER